MPRPPGLRVAHYPEAPLAPAQFALVSGPPEQLMILTFASDEVRRQIAHATAAKKHRDVAGKEAPEPPALLLVKESAGIYLVSNGLPKSRAVARAEAAEPAPANDAGGGDTPEPLEFVEPITLGSFTKALANGRSSVTVVVRPTYINVLGGQPERVTPPLQSRSRGSRSF